MLVTLRWWRIWDVGGRIIILATFFRHQHSESVTNISNLSPTHLVSNIHVTHFDPKLRPRWILTSVNFELLNSLQSRTYEFIYLVSFGPLWWNKRRVERLTLRTKQANRQFDSFQSLVQNFLHLTLLQYLCQVMSHTIGYTIVYRNLWIIKYES